MYQSRSDQRYVWRGADREVISNDDFPALIYSVNNKSTPQQLTQAFIYSIRYNMIQIVTNNQKNVEKQ